MSSTDLCDALTQEIEGRLKGYPSLKWTSFDCAKVRQRYSLSAHAAWQIALPPDYLEIDRQLILTVPKNLEDEAPSAFVTPSAYQQWPHAEASGKLCLWPSSNPPSLEPVSKLCNDFFDRIGRVLTLSQIGNEADREAHFVDEWLSYWAPKSKSASVVYLLSAASASVSDMWSRCLIRAGTPMLNGRRRQPGEIWRSITVISSDRAELDDWGSDFVDIARPAMVNDAVLIRLTRLSSPCMPNTFGVIYLTYHA